MVTLMLMMSPRRQRQNHRRSSRSHRQEWAGLDWTSRNGQGDRRVLREPLPGLCCCSNEPLTIFPDAWAVT